MLFEENICVFFDKHSTLITNRLEGFYKNTIDKS